MLPAIRSKGLPVLTLLALLAVALLAAPPAAAQLLPDGPLVDVGGIGLGGFAPGGAALDDHRPRVVMDATGGFIVFWYEAEKDPDRPRLLARRYEADGTPLWQEREFWDPVDGVETVGGLTDVAMNADGDFVIVWIDPERGVLARFFDVCGDWLGPIIEVGIGNPQEGTEVLGVEGASVALTPVGTAVVAWSQVLQQVGEEGPTFEGVVTQRILADGSFIAPFQRIVADSSISNLEVQAGPDNGYGIVVEAPTVDPAASYVRFSLFDADGQPLVTPPLPPDVPDHPSRENPDVGVNGLGDWMVSFVGGGGQGANGVDGSCTGVFARFYDPEGLLRFDEARVNPRPEGCQGAPRVVGLDGGWLVAWAGADRDEAFAADGSEHGLYVRAYDSDGAPEGGAVRVLPAAALPYDLASGGGKAVVAGILEDESGEPRVVVRLLSESGTATCTGDDLSDHLCLQGDRFRVDADWRDPYNGGSGSAFGRELRPDSGALWFFRDTNLELMVKVLDGRPVDGHWWVFYGALSTVEYWVTVTDLTTGRQNVYHNPPFVQASVADTSAFDGDGGEGGGAAAVVPPSIALLPDAAAVDLAAGPESVTGDLTPATCDVEPFQLCLQDARFRVIVDWEDPRSGDMGVGTKLAITDDTGAFSFFNEDNLELMVKVLDGRPVNGHWWVIYAGLSDVAYTLRVVDTETDQEAVYANDPFELRSGADTTAFDGQ